MYNPQEDLPIHLEMQPGSKVISLLIRIEKFHTFFTEEAELIHFLSGENKSKKCYRDKELNPNEMVFIDAINQLKDNGIVELVNKHNTIIFQFFIVIT